MDYKKLTNDFSIPVLGLGTWGIGGYAEADYSKDLESIQIIKDAIKLGYTHIDTAESYGDGHTEELIGEAIKDFDRSELIITSKVSKSNLKYDDVLEACKTSLQNLQTDYIDIYLIHSFNPEIPLETTIKAMDYLVENKLVRHIGVSNFSVDQMKEAQKLSKNKIITNQIPYNLATRDKSNVFRCIDMESKIIPYCQENDINVMAYWPTAGGSILKPNSILDDLSNKYGKTKVQIAINWLISKKNIITIPKSANLDHLRENLGAIGWKLSDEDMKILDEAEFKNPNAQFVYDDKE